MKNKNTIESLKKEGLVTTADKIRIWEFKTEKAPSGNIIIVSYEDNEILLWIHDFLKRKNKRFEDFSIEIEELYSEKAVKRNLKAKTTQETHVSDNTESGKTIKNRNNANWRSDFIKNKTGYTPNEGYF